MGYSELYEYLRSLPDEELIEGWDWATDSEGGEIPSAVLDYTAGVKLPTRDVIQERGLEEKVKEYDIRLLKYVLKKRAYPLWEKQSGEINPPLSSWWWWLYEISKGEYPAELLPEYLRGIYQDWLKEKKSS